MTRWRQWLREDPSTETLKRIEGDFDRRFVPAIAARTLMAGLPVKELRSHPKGSRMGTDGFAFISGDTEVCTSAGFLSSQFGHGRSAGDALGDLSDQLRHRGVHLLVVPVPAKSSIYPERLDPGYDVSRGPNLNVDHAAWIALLRQRGVDVLDLSDEFWTSRYLLDEAKPVAPGGIPGGVLNPDGSCRLLYYQGDTHWSFRGMRMAAEQIAERIRPLASDVPKSRGFERRPVRRTYQGDMSLLSDVSTGLRPPDVQDVRIELHWPDGGAVVPGDQAPILVIGDSYAAQFVNEGSSLSQQVMDFLGIEVQSAAEIGGLADSMRKPLHDRPDLLKNKRVVVLAFAIRTVVLEEWHRMSIAG